MPITIGQGMERKIVQKTMGHNYQMSSIEKPPDGHHDQRIKFLKMGLRRFQQKLSKWTNVV